jgi:hypothetical protein
MRSSFSRIQNGGRPLRLAYPISGKNTFRPSGNPDTDPPEREVESDLDQIRKILGVDTPSGMQRLDRELAAARGPRDLATKQQCEYWDRIRFLQMKSPRARKRAEEREARRMAKLLKDPAQRK